MLLLKVNSLLVNCKAVSFFVDHPVVQAPIRLTPGEADIDCDSVFIAKLCNSGTLQPKLLHQETGSSKSWLKLEAASVENKPLFSR